MCLVIQLQENIIRLGVRVHNREFCHHFTKRALSHRDVPVYRIHEDHLIVRDSVGMNLGYGRCHPLHDAPGSFAISIDDIPFHQQVVCFQRWVNALILHLLDYAFSRKHLV